MKKIIFTMLLVFLCSCVGNKGAKFTTLIEPKKDEVVIYFYRPSSFGGLVYYRVKDEENKSITTIYQKSYYPYVTKKVGARKFTAETEAGDTISFDVEAGNTYFVESGLKFGILVGRPKFKLTTNKDQAIKDLGVCSISND